MEEKTIAIFGPPGTGKTHYLLKCVDHQIKKGVSPRKIGYFAFTRKAANEAKERVKRSYSFPNSVFRYFCTIHSFAFRQLSIQREQVINLEKLKVFGDEYLIDMSGESNVWDQDIFEKNRGYLKGDRIMFVDSLSRVTFREHADIMREIEFDEDLRSPEVRMISEAYRNWKNEHHFLDYTDMLEQFIEKARVPEFEIVIVDEAQDLSALQWKVIEKIAENVRVVYLAGDDDQAIYRWAGADIDRFINIQSRSKVLDQSYRIPPAIQNFANDIINRVGNRRPKIWSPRSSQGQVIRVNSIGYIENKIMDGGEWLILSRNKKFLREWQHLSEPPRVRVGTIHASKGGEADNVVIIPDITPRVDSWMNHSQGYEDECRVFYVGITRAKENLYVMDPTTDRRFEL